MAVFNWSQTAASNNTADPTINWSEGMAPSQVNDSARAMMAALAKFRDDVSGSIATGGTSTAYTVTSNSSYDTLAHLHNQLIAFVPNATSTNAVGVDVTLNVDSLGAKPIRGQPGVALPTGTLVSGTPYFATYNNTDGVFYLHGMTNQYAIPLGGAMPYVGGSAPNSCFAFPFGQAISRTTYATLFSLIGTTWGTGDGSTTFNIPDVRGRTIAGVDNMGGSAAGRLTSASGMGTGLLAQSGGTETHTIAQANLPSVNFAVSGTVSGTVTGGVKAFANAAGSLTAGGTTGGPATDVALHDIAVSTSLSGATAASGGSGTGLATIPPMICFNYIIRII